MDSPRSNSIRALTSSKTQHWCTPLHLSKAILEVLGEIDLDPCSNKYSIIPALTYWFEENGEQTFSSEWSFAKTVYCNPPFSPAHLQDKFVMKCIKEKKGKEILMLLPVRTGTNRWQQYVLKKYDAICYFKGRVNFDLQGKKTKSSTVQTCMIYLGNRPKRFKKIFSIFGYTELKNKNKRTI